MTAEATAAPAAPEPAPKAAEQAKGDVQEQVDEEQEKGYRGTKVDPLPDEHYTFPGPSKEEHAAETGDADVV